MKCFARAPMLVMLASLAAFSAAPSTLQPKAWAQGQGPTTQAAETGPVIRSQEVRRLPGGLDQVLVLNDNNPELISGEGILVSTFPESPGLNLAFNGRFDLFSHHVYAGMPDRLDSTLWLAVVAQPASDQSVTLELLGGSTSLSQAVSSQQTASPFLPLPSLIEERGTPIAAGPGSRVAGDLLRGDSAAELSRQWTIQPGRATPLVLLPIPVAGLDPLLNGRNLQMRLHSSGPVHVATLATYGDGRHAPSAADWQALLNSGKQSPKEHKPTPRSSRGRIIYSRVSGIQIGSTWQAELTDPGSKHLDLSATAISWPISSLANGDLRTGQIQTAELEVFDPGTAWAAHGNYGVEYDLTLPLRNPSAQKRTVAIALESPDKNNSTTQQLAFRRTSGGPVMFRGPIEVTGLDDEQEQGSGPRRFHLVLRRGQQGPELGQVSLDPGESRRVRVRLVYPADATPPQVLSLLPVKQSSPESGDRP